MRRAAEARGQRRAALLMGLSGFLLLWACLGPHIADGSIACDDEARCPEGYECAVDGRCYRYAGECGDSILDPGETCDPASLCPTSCNDGNACSKDLLLGSESSCNLRCSHGSVEACQDGDGCCPDGCGFYMDNDCSPTCGDGVVDPLETCEKAGCDAITCNDGDSCTNDIRAGETEQCNVRCVYSTIDACMDGDGCCPNSCNSKTDDDCSATCGNGIIEDGELCDPPSSCPGLEDCDDGSACTVDTLVGSSANCNAYCKHSGITACEAGDGCCPDAGCGTALDSDCQGNTTCGNEMLDEGETCDDSTEMWPCPTDCDAISERCMLHELVGSADTCTAECVATPINECGPRDGCCPPGCEGGSLVTTDPDCSPVSL